MAVNPKNKEGGYGLVLCLTLVNWLLLLPELVTVVISPPADVSLLVSSSFIRIILQSRVGEPKMYPPFN